MNSVLAFKMIFAVLSLWLDIPGGPKNEYLENYQRYLHDFFAHIKASVY